MAGWPAAQVAAQVAAAAAVCLVLLGGAATSPLPQEAPAGGPVQKINDACKSSVDCANIENSACNRTLGTCQCISSYPVPNVISCLPAASINTTCRISAQCQRDSPHSECVRGVCACKAEYYLHSFQDGVSSCLHVHGASKKNPVDPVMIGILASLVLMFVIICVVLRLFSKAQFRQNRTILNSANPRLANASFFRGPTIKSPVDQLTRRSSGDSRAPSLASLQRDEAAETEPTHGYSDESYSKRDGGADPNQVEVEVNQDGR